MKKKLLFIINPNSGHKKGADIIGIIPRYLDIDLYDYDYRLTDYPHHATELARRAVNNGFYGVIAVGGDGIVNEIFQALTNTNTALGIIPMGSGNGVARSIGVKSKITDALCQLNTAEIKTMDTVMFDDKPYLGVGGIGFDGLIAHRFATTNKRGLWTYVKLILKELISYESVNYTITTSEGQYQFDAYIAAFANTQQYGNDARIAPLANINDGHLDLVIVKKRSKWLLPILAFEVMTGKAHRSKFIETLQADQFTIETTMKKAHIDGEPILINNRSEVKILPSSLKILI